MFWLAGLALIVVGVLGLFLAGLRFERRIDAEARALLVGVPTGGAGVVQADELERLPPPVRRWLQVSGVVGRERARSARLRQHGLMRTARGQPWMPVVAEQYFSVEEPGFVWKVHARMLGFLPLVGRDRCVGGKGHMAIKLLGLVSVADARGPEIDQGALLRFLGEIVWFPSAALAPYIHWEALDASSARATISWAGVTASAVFAFDDHGRFSRLSAKRYMHRADGATLEHWLIPATEWRTMDGVEVPIKGHAIWQLASGDLDYYRWEISELELNRPRLYADDLGDRQRPERPRPHGVATPMPAR